MQRARTIQVIVAVVLLGATVFCCVWLAIPPLYEGRARGYLPLFRAESAEWGVPLFLLLAVVNAESAFDARAVSDAGAVGLMQVMPATAGWVAASNGWAYAPEMLYEPAYNVRVGAAYLAYLATKFEGEWVYAAYNAGEGMAAQWIKEGVSADAVPYRETREYVRKVRKLSKAYARRGYSC